MRNSNLTQLVITFAVLIVCPLTRPAENPSGYTVTAGHEQLHFIAQPQAGYVLKTQDDISSMDSVSRFLKNTGNVKINPICGLGRKGTYVVYNERPADERGRRVPGWVRISSSSTIRRPRAGVADRLTRFKIMLTP